MVVRNKCGGYWNKTRSTVDSGGLGVTCTISTTNMFQPTVTIITHHVSLCRTGHNRLDEDRRQARVYPRQRLPRVPPGMHERHMMVTTIQNISNSNSMDHQNALMSLNVSSHKITDTPCRGGIATVSDNTHKIMPGFRMLAFKLWGGRVHSKTFESFLLSPKFLFKIFLNQYIVSKTVPKSCLIFLK